MRACQERTGFLQFRAHARNECFRASPIWSAAAFQHGIISHVSLSSLFDRLKKTTLKVTCDCDCLALCLFGIDSAGVLPWSGEDLKCWYVAVNRRSAPIGHSP